MNTVCIRKFQRKDIPNKVRWINDEENNKYLHYDLPLEINKTEAWYDSIKSKTDRYDAVIECNGDPVGIIGLLSIEDGKAEYYITIGEKEFKGKGIALEASRELLNYAKEQLGLDQVYLYTEVDNIPAQKLFEKLGFCKQGVEKNSAYNRGKLVDRYFYELQL